MAVIKEIAAVDIVRIAKVAGVSIADVKKVAGVARLWTPADITTALWLDAADASTITESGGLVSQWDDKSGNGNDVTQGNSAKQPTYNATGFNGFPTIEFDGSADVLNGTASGTSATAWTWFCVINDQTGAGDNIFLLDIETGRLNFLADGRPSTGPAFYDTGTYYNSNSDVAGLQQIAMEADDNGRIFRDGSVIYSPTYTYSDTGYAGLIGVGGRYSGTSSFYTGAISEMILVPTKLSDADRQKIEGYLAWKWGLEANLPSGHPYKSAAPTV